MKFVLLFISFFLTAAGFSQGIKFTVGTWAEIKELAKRENKPIFIDAYTSWCGPCKKMAKEVFTLDSVGAYFNKKFVSFQMDMEKGDGIEFAKKYEVNAFPTLLYFNASGEMISKTVGYKDGAPLIKTSEEALDPKNQIPFLTQQYEESKKTLDDLMLYASRLSSYDNYRMAAGIVVDRLGKLTEEEKYTKQEWMLLRNYLSDYQSPLFRSVLENKAKYEKLVAPGAVDQYIDMVLKGPVRFPPDSTEAGLQKYYLGVEQYKNYINVDYYKAYAAYFYYLKRKDESKKFEAAKNFLDHDYPDEKMPYFLAYMANDYLEKDGERLSAAMRWAERSVRMDTADYKNKFVLAQLLYKQGKYKEALPLAEEALLLEKKATEAGVIKKLFNVKAIPEFIEQVKGKL